MRIYFHPHNINHSCPSYTQEHCSSCKLSSSLISALTPLTHPPIVQAHCFDFSRTLNQKISVILMLLLFIIYLYSEDFKLEFNNQFKNGFVSYFYFCFGQNFSFLLILNWFVLLLHLHYVHSFLNCRFFTCETSEYCSCCVDKLY